MSARERALAFAVAALAALWAVVAAVEHEPSVVGRTLLRFDPAAVARVHLERGGASLTLERAGDGWVVASHGRIPARPGAVEDLLTRLRGWRIERSAGDDPTRHREWYVDRERARRIRLEAADGTVLGQVWVGQVTGIEQDAPDGQLDLATLGLFARASQSGDPPPNATWVVNAFVTRQLDTDPRRWFVSPLLSGRPEEVTALTLERGGARVALRWDEHGVRFDPPGWPVDAGAARSLALQVYLLEATGAAPEGAAPAPDAVRVRVACGGAEEALTLWRQGEGWVLEGPLGRVAVTTPPAEAIAGASQDGLARRRLFTGDALDVRRVHLRDAETEWSLAADVRAREWDAVVTGNTRLRHRRLPHPAVAPLLEALIGLPVTRWQPGPLPGPARATWIVVGAGGRQEVAIGPRRGDLLAVEVPGAGVAWVPAGAATDAVGRLTALVEGR